MLDASAQPIVQEADAVIVGFQRGREAAGQSTSQLHGAVGDEDQAHLALGSASSLSRAEALDQVGKDAGVEQISSQVWQMWPGKLDVPLPVLLDFLLSGLLVVLGGTATIAIGI